MEQAPWWGHMSLSRPPARAPRVPSPLPPCWHTPPWSLQLCEAPILQQTLPFLMCVDTFLPHEYLVCGLFCLRRIHLHFPMMICTLPLALPIFLIPLGYAFALCWCLSHFSIQNHLRISSSSSFSLPKVVNKDRSEWDRRKGQLPNPPWRPPSWASPVSCRLFTSTQHIFPSTWQDGRPRWSAFIYAMSQDPLVAAKLQNS